ncbi:MAG: helix-turn-helix transcriptional regulator [Candidatus Thorarchaeota archaeon]
MRKPRIHVSILDNEKTIEYIMVRRQIDELMLVHTEEQTELARDLRSRFREVGLRTLLCSVRAGDFNSTLASILRGLDECRFDDCEIEFSIGSVSPLLAMAAGVAAAILEASVISLTDGAELEMTEIWPSEIVNLTSKKREILGYLESKYQVVSQKEISRETGIRQSGVSRHLTDLEKAGYVVRERGAKRKLAQITDLGSAILHHKQIRKRRLWGPYVTSSTHSVQTAG